MELSNTKGNLAEMPLEVTLIEIKETAMVEEQESDQSDATTSISVPKKSSEKKTVIHTVTAKELMALDLHEIPYLLKPLLPKKGLVTLVGSSDTGKSTFLRQLALAISQEKETFLDFVIDSKNHKVIIVSTEDDDSSTSVLLRKQLKDADQGHLENLRYIFDSDDILTKLKESLKQESADLIIIDAFPDLFGGEMNQANKVRSFLNEYKNLAVQYDCLCLFLHHNGKRTEDSEPSKNNILGSQGFEAKMRLVLELRKDFGDPSLRHLCVVKGNYLPESDKGSSYVLKMDDNMVYSNTGMRVPFSHLKRPTTPSSNDETLRSRATELHNDGKSVRDIADIISSEGNKIGKSTIAKIIKKAPSVQPTLLEETDNGQDN